MPSRCFGPGAVVGVLRRSGVGSHLQEVSEFPDTAAGDDPLKSLVDASAVIRHDNSRKGSARICGQPCNWVDRAGMDSAMRQALTLEAARRQHLEGVVDSDRVDPDMWTLDQHRLDAPGWSRKSCSICSTTIDPTLRRIHEGSRGCANMPAASTAMEPQRSLLL